MPSRSSKPNSNCHPSNANALAKQGFRLPSDSRLRPGHSSPDRVLSLQSNYYPAMLNRAIAYLRSEQLDAAKQDYEVLQKALPTESTGSIMASVKLPIEKRTPRRGPKLPALSHQFSTEYGGSQIRQRSPEGTGDPARPDRMACGSHTSIYASDRRRRPGEHSCVSVGPAAGNPAWTS